MKFCHRCETEYIPDFDKCPDCGGALHDAPGLDEGIVTNEKEWVVVHRTKDQQTAEMIHGLLKSNGITTVVRDPAGVLNHLYGPFPFFGGTVDIYVHEENIGKARDLIASNKEWSEEELTEFMESQGLIEDEDEEGVEKIGL
ncbi:DUF2007 domain-containing protein [bacterium]|nr:DUF2007 domain-containing protein [bacterium]